jgi:hypothetical protein
MRTALRALVVEIVDKTILEDMASDMLNGALTGGFDTPPGSPVPLPVTFESPTVELIPTPDDVAPTPPPMATPLGGALAPIMGGYDLYLGARFSKLIQPTAADPNPPLFVSFVISDSADQGGRLDGIGGVLKDGTEWRLPIDQAIALVDAGRELIVKNPPAPEVRVTVHRGEVPYLQTGRDDFGENNLGNLPIKK